MSDQHVHDQNQRSPADNFLHQLSTPRAREILNAQGNLQPVDELHDASGALRNSYQRLSQCLGSEVLYPTESRTRFFEEKPLGDSISIAAVPLVLPRAEHQLLYKGTEQHILALTRLFEDLVLGDAAILSDQRGIPKKIIDYIMKHSSYGSLAQLREIWTARSIADITFHFGSDLARDQNRQIVVIEFNLGPLGGKADNYHIHKRFLDSLESKHRAVGVSDLPFHFQVDPISGLHAFAEFRDGVLTPGRAIASGIAPSAEDREKIQQALEAGYHIDLEHLRWQGLLREAGVQVLDEQAHQQALQTDKPAFIFNEVDDCKFATAAFTGRTDVHLLNAPGTATLLSNKLLLPYLSNITQFYLDEDPLITTPACYVGELVQSPGELGFGFRSVDPNCKYRVNSNDMRGIVTKDPDSDQGEGVFIVNDDTYEVFRESHTLAIADLAYLQEDDDLFSEYSLLQRRIELSQLNSHRIDLRPIAIALGAGQAHVQTLPWGRAVSTEGHEATKRWGDDQKTNVSIAAKELVVLAER